jgi:hypothetical protein
MLSVVVPIWQLIYPDSNTFSEESSVIHYNLKKCVFQFSILVKINRQALNQNSVAVINNKEMSIKFLQILEQRRFPEWSFSNPHFFPTNHNLHPGANVMQHFTSLIY